MAVKKDSLSKFYIAAVCLSIFSVFIGIIPYLFGPAFSNFFSMDPDPMYIGNALQLLQTGRVFFMDHPGTPLISLLSFSYLPIKLYASLVLKIPNFPVYFLKHLDFVYFYTRVFLTFIYMLGLFLFHLILLKRYKKIVLNIFFGLALFLDGMHLGMYWAITPEILAFTLTSFWLYFLNKFEETKNIKFIYLASFLTGLIFATKMSFLFVVFANFLFLYLRFGKSITIFFKKGMYVIFHSAIYSGLGFVLGILPLWYKKRELFMYILGYFFHTGKMGLGSVGLVDIPLFRSSLLGLISHPLILIVFVVFLLFALRYLKNDLLIKSILISSLIGFIVFTKYADFHYQTANLLLMVLTSGVIYIRLPSEYRLIILVILLPFFIDSVNQNYIIRKNLVTESYLIQHYIESKDISGKIVWEYARSRDYGALRSLEWSGFSFLDDFKNVFPKTLSLDWRDQSKIANFPYNPSIPLNTTCWDLLILQRVSWDNFIKVQKDAAMYIKENIPGTEMLSVTYKNHSNCKTKNNK